MRRIERDPVPFQWSEDNFRHLEVSLLRAELKRQKQDKPSINWSAVKGTFLGMTISIAFWWVFIYTVIWAVERVRR